MIHRGINYLTKDNLELALSNTYTGLAMWNGGECRKCLEEFWTIQGLFCTFERERNVRLRGKDKD